MQPRYSDIQRPTPYRPVVVVAGPTIGDLVGPTGSPDTHPGLLAGRQITAWRAVVRIPHQATIHGIAALQGAGIVVHHAVGIVGDEAAALSRIAGVLGTVHSILADPLLSDAPAPLAGIVLGALVVIVAVTGNDLKEMGYEPGPIFREILTALLEARLNGEVRSRNDEIEFVQMKWNAQGG